MQIKRWMAGLLGKVMAILSGRPDLEPSEPALAARGKYAPKENDPLEIKFVKRFTDSGGFFLFSDLHQEIVNNLVSINLEIKPRAFWSPEPEVQKLLEEAQVPLSQSSSDADVMVTTAEALVAFTGGIMITDNQTGGLKASQFPPVHVALAKTSQLVDSLSDGMRRINNATRVQRPQQIITLKGKLDESVRQASADPNKPRDLYLLLFEDGTL
jgi:L-lactate dehydrogenase complex protein LldG